MTGPVWDGQGVDPWLPARLEARAETARVERDIREVVWAALSNWLVKLSRRVLSGGERPDLDAIWAMAPLWREAVDAILRGEVLRAIGVAFARVLGPGSNYAARPFVTAYLAEVRNRLVRVPDDVYDLVAGELAQGVNLGENLDKLRARVDSVLSTTGSERWPNRATVIARTECLPGEAMVDGAHATAVYRRWYSGQMVTVKTVGGREFTGTPNHPVLTPNGWTGLGQLLDGDHLICDSRSVQTTGAPGNQHVEARPIPISQVFDAAQAIGVSRRERTAQPDFHGDGPEGYVDVLGTFGVLTLGRFAKIDKGSVDLFLTPSETEKVTLACDRAPFPRGDSIDQPTSLLGVPPPDASGEDQATDDLQVGSVRYGEGLARLSCHVPGHDLLLRKVVPQSWALTSSLEELLTRVGEGPELDTALDQGIPNPVRAESGLSSDFAVAQPGEVEADEVVSIEVREWSGHVYNLTTVDGYFVSDGVYTGNTIGALNAGRYDAFRIVAADADEPMEAFWISTDDQRTRHSHEEAEGQRVPVGSPFIVGGFELRFPGDPSGPPQETIQCRCTMLLVERGESVDLSNRQMRK